MKKEIITEMITLLDARDYWEAQKKHALEMIEIADNALADLDAQLFQKSPPVIKKQQLSILEQKKE